MPLNSPKIPLATAYPDLIKEDSAKGRTFRGRMIIEGGFEKIGYIKLLSAEELSREALFSVLGRRLALPIPQPFYVQVDPLYVGASSFSSMYGVAFASEAELLPHQRILQDDALLNIGSWSEIYHCATFDAWIANRDRLPHNILYAGNLGYWLIDHEEALPSNVAENEAVGTQLARKIAESKSELELFRAREKMLKFVEAFHLVNWNEVRESLRLNEMVEISLLCEQHIALLKDRLSHMRAILSKDLGITQQELSLGVSRTDNRDIGQ